HVDTPGVVDDEGTDHQPLAGGRSRLGEGCERTARRDAAHGHRSYWRLVLLCHDRMAARLRLSHAYPTRTPSTSTNSARNCSGRDLSAFCDQKKCSSANPATR